MTHDDACEIVAAADGLRAAASAFDKATACCDEGGAWHMVCDYLRTEPAYHEALGYLCRRKEEREAKP